MLFAIDAKSDTWSALNSSSKVEIFRGRDWRDVYTTGKPYGGVNGYGDLYLVVDDFTFDPGFESAPNATSISYSDYLPSSCLGPLYFFDIQLNDSLPWIEFRTFNRFGWTEDAPTWPRKARVNHAFGVIFEVQSRIQLIRDFMIVVILFDFLKVMIMLWVLATDRSDYLVTLGDALASYLERPDPLTEGHCMLDKGGHLFILGERSDLAPDVDSHDNFNERLDGIWSSRRLRYSMLLPEDRQKVFMIL